MSKIKSLKDYEIINRIRNNQDIIIDGIALNPLEVLCEEYIDMVRKKARKYHVNEYDYNDLVQAGLEAIIYAVNILMRIKMFLSKDLSQIS